MATSEHDRDQAAPAHAAAVTEPAHATRGSVRLQRLIVGYGSRPDQLALGIIATHAARDQELWAAIQQALGNSVSLEVHKAVAEKSTAPVANEVMVNETDIDGSAIAVASQQYGVPDDEIRAIITQESRGDAQANAGVAQRDHGQHAASGLMQVTEQTWKQTQHSHPELAPYDFATYRYDRRVNILVGTAVLASKRRALVAAGIDPRGAHTPELTSTAYNAGEAIVKVAYSDARKAGSTHPDVDCLRPEYLKPAIAAHPEVYAYYLTGGGMARNKEGTVDGAIELKFEEISRYPVAIVAAITADEDRRVHEQDEIGKDVVDPIFEGQHDGHV